MNEIKILDNATINKIAAGEVVERPASVVKELAENAIDAGASSINIEIKDGGLSLIKVSDNGCGIVRSEVKTAFIRHATNKISDIHDLSSVMSLGFRGEALASIASVSQLELLTKTASEDIGTKIEIYAGNIVDVSDIAIVTGSTFFVRNLFYNVPVRKRFLKKPSTESSYVTDIVSRLALGHPEVSFKYVNNGSVSLQTSGNNNIRTTVFYVYGKETADKMLDINFEYDNNKLYGLLGKPEICRSNRTYGNLFINGRFVKNELIQKAVEECYKTRLPIGKFPVFILYLEIPPDTVDVNVHPTKLEVRFVNEQHIYQFILEAISKVFSNETLIPKVTWDCDSANDNIKPDINDTDSKFKVNDENVDLSIINHTHINDSTSEDDNNIMKKNNNFNNVVDTDFTSPYKEVSYTATSNEEQMNNVASHSFANEIKSDYSEETVQSKLTDKTSNNNCFFNNYKIIGQLYNTYWILEQNNIMYIVDQHAAHERILYEKVLAEYQTEKTLSQKTVEPMIVALLPGQLEVILSNRTLLESFGFDFELFGDSSLAITSVPVIFKNPVSVQFFLDIIDLLQCQTVDDVYDAKPNSIATIACKAAVTANDTLSVIEARHLIEQLLEIENPFTCPHGRPTIIEISKYELEKKFKRV